MLSVGKDPAEKLQELHKWLLENKVQSKFPEKRTTVTTAWAMGANSKADREVAEFKEWLQEIQSSSRTPETVF